ncbi:hypothetical protein ACYATP_00215 [Lactobacillaceae bacterium Melli_B4]
MAKNGPKGGGRIGAIKGREQAFNSKTGQFVKIDTNTHKFIGNKSTPFKGVRKHK